VNIGHNAYLLVSKDLDGKQLAYLLQCAILHIVRKNLYVVTFDCFHIIFGYIIFLCNLAGEYIYQPVRAPIILKADNVADCQMPIKIL